MATTNQILGFVARLSALPSDSEALWTWLDESISFAEQTYRIHYGGLGCRPTRRLMFVHQSSAPVSMASKQMKFINDILDEGKSTNREVVLVILGWDGLTSNAMAFTNLFQRCLDEPDLRCRIRVFAEVPRRFFDVNIRQALKFLRWGADDDFEWEGSTERFCSEIRRIFAIEEYSPEGIDLLLEETHKRNDHPGWVLDYKYSCPVEGCDEKFFRSDLREWHLHNQHPELFSADGTRPDTE